MSLLFGVNAEGKITVPHSCGRLTLCNVDPHTVLVMNVERKLWFGLMAGVAAMTMASAPASASALMIQYLQVCYLTQSSTGGYTIEECRIFMPSRFYHVRPLRRFRRDSFR